MPDASEHAPDKPSLFISYAHADATDLVIKLSDDLADEWRIVTDRIVLGVGVPWDTRLEQHIAHVKVAIFVLTPRSVRADGVCRNELHLLQQRRIPVGPVMWRRCDPPLTLEGIHYIDFEVLSYDEALAQLRRGLAALLAGEPAPRTQHIDETWSLGPEFRDVLEGRSAETFWARRGLTDRISRWRERDTGARAIILTAEPGSGKSALAAHLSDTQCCGPVLAAHFCGWRVRQTLQPESLVRNLAYTLEQRLPAYREALQTRRAEQVLSQFARDGGNEIPVDVLRPILLHPLRDMPDPFEPGEAPAWLILDGLDEADEYAQERSVPSIVGLIVMLLETVPPWLRLLVTCRPGDVPALLCRQYDRRGRPLAQEHAMSVAESVEEVRSYVAHRLAAARIPAVEALEIIASRSEGNFLFAKLVVDGLEQGTYDLSTLRRLPHSLEGIYLDDLRRLYKRAGHAHFNRVARPLLAVLGTAQAGISISAEFLAEVTRLSQDDVDAELRRLRAYIPLNAEHYSVFHKSFADWFQDKAVSEEFLASEEDGHSALARFCIDHFRRLQRELGELVDLQHDDCAVYLLRFGIDHMVAASRLPEAVELLASVTDLIETHASEGLAMPAALSDVAPGRFRRRVMRGLGKCQPDDYPLIDAELLSRLVMDFYQIDLLYEPVEILLRHHPDRSPELQQAFIASDNYVLRYVVSEVIAEAWPFKDDPSRIETIYKYLEEGDTNTQELAAYVLQHVYKRKPAWISQRHIELMAESLTYAGRSALGDLWLSLTYRGRADVLKVESKIFWEPIWDHNRLDVWDLKAARSFLANSPLPAQADAGTRRAYDAFNETEVFRETVERQLAESPDTDRRIRKLVGRDLFRSLEGQPKMIRSAEPALSRSPHLKMVMRLLFAHPQWVVAEKAASVLASLAEEDKETRSIVLKLLDDPYWRVRFGAIEASYQLAEFDAMELFGQAVEQFYGDDNCRVRALCAENLTAHILSCAPSVQETYLTDFEPAIRRWVCDDDAWVSNMYFGC